MNKLEAIRLLQLNGIEVSHEFEILYPKRDQFDDEVHEAIEFLMEEWDFGFKYI